MPVRKPKAGAPMAPPSPTDAARAWWSVDQARRWIVHHDPERLLDAERLEPCWPPAPPGVIDRTSAASMKDAADAERALTADMIDVLRQAGEALKAAVGDGLVRALGQRSEGADPEPIPAVTMLNPAAMFALAGGMVVPDQTKPGWIDLPLPIFRNVLVCREDVERQWPLLTGTQADAVAWFLANPTHQKYEDAIKDCVSKTGCTHRDAKAAWKAGGMTRKRGRKGNDAAPR